MARKRLNWQLFPSYLFIILLSLIAVGWYATASWRSFFENQLRAQLRKQARLALVQMRDTILEGDLAEIDALCKDLGKAADIRFTVIDHSGKVLGDSHENPRQMENHSDRVEVQKAQAGESYSAMRFSDTLRRWMVYTAEPVKVGRQTVAVLRTSMAEEAIADMLSATYARFAVGGFLVAVVAGLMSWFVARRLTRPLEQLREGAERFARGGLTENLPVPETLEYARLATAMNQMAHQLDERIRTVIRQRNEQEAMLASMVEGVFAVDLEERVISLNQAAAGLLSTRVERALGKSLQEVVRNTELQSFVKQALEAPQPVSEEIVLYDGQSERFLQAHGTVLRSEPQGEGIGALVVLHDVTQVRRLENIRREFVANVSHELRTPITSITGFVETLLSGAKDDPEDLERFLGIIRRHVERLNNIIEDLLSLSRIEQNEEQGGIELEVQPLRPILETVVQNNQRQATPGEIRLELACDEALRAEMNLTLMEQAVGNLVENAVKYSGAGSMVRIEAESLGTEIAIHVRDQGCGIPAEHLARVFERFYRVDKARSRKQGGTGLGLSIVKHLVQIHRGRVAVESEVGVGSVFSIFLPVAAPDVQNAGGGDADAKQSG